MQSITNSRSSLRLTSIESVMPFSHPILYRALLLLPPILPSIRVFSNESTLHMRWPISLAIGMYSASAEKPLCVFTVRKEAKDHGRGKRIEGNFSAGQQVIVVDDVITTGGSTLKAIDAIEAEGGKVVAALVLVDRQEGGREAIESRGIPVFPMFTRASIFGDK